MNKYTNQLQFLEDTDRYALFIESIKDFAVFIVDPSGIVLSWNYGAENVLGYTHEETIGKPYSLFYQAPEPERLDIENEMATAKLEGRFEDEGWRVKKTGEEIWANGVLTPVLKDGKLIGFTKVVLDLTRRKNLEDELRISEMKARLFVEGVKDYAIFFLTPDGNIASWNQGAERLKGYKKEEVLGKHFSLFYTEEALKSGFPQYELVEAAKQGRFEDEGWRVRSDGTVFWANVVITPIYNKDLLIGFSKITRDVTNKVKNEELMRKNKMLLKINTDLDNFIYTASHDLKAPIANLEGLIFLLSKRIQGRLSDEEQKILNMMKQSIEKLRRTIDDLKEITKAQKGLDDKMEEISITSVLEEVKSDIENMIQEADAQFIESLEVTKIRFAKANLRTILYNLISNAVKYRSPDRPLNIVIKTYALDSEIALSISDNGLGLSENQQSKLFMMFKRFHSNTEGTGIGLYIIKRIVENAGGHIEAQSELDKGTTFTIFFPVNSGHKKGA
jgi:PAS domain S-box-containing protein